MYQEWMRSLVSHYQVQSTFSLQSPVQGIRGCQSILVHLCGSTRGKRSDLSMEHGTHASKHDKDDFLLMKGEMNTYQKRMIRKHSRHLHLALAFCLHLPLPPSSFHFPFLALLLPPSFSLSPFFPLFQLPSSFRNDPSRECKAIIFA